MDSISAKKPIDVSPKAEGINKPAPEAKPEKTELNSKDLVQLSGALGELKSGDKVTINLDGKQKVEIIKTSKPFGQKFTEAAQAVGAQVYEAVSADPSFSFRESVQLAKGTIVREAPELIQSLVDKGLLPTVRAASLGIDIHKAIATLKDPAAGLIRKTVDVVHCLTDIAGLIGSLSPIIPFAAPAAPILTAVALIGDVMAFGSHSMAYVQQKALKAKQAAAANPK